MEFVRETKSSSYSCFVMGSKYILFYCFKRELTTMEVLCPLLELYFPWYWNRVSFTGSFTHQLSLEMEPKSRKSFHIEFRTEIRVVDSLSGLTQTVCSGYSWSRLVWRPPKEGLHVTPPLWYQLDVYCIQYILEIDVKPYKKGTSRIWAYLWKVKIYSLDSNVPKGTARSTP